MFQSQFTKTVTRTSETWKKLMAKIITSRKEIAVSQVKTVLVVPFFDSQEIVHEEFMPENTPSAE
jgi:hypothetical protein